jgi:hypothetical protein
LIDFKTADFDRMMIPIHKRPADIELTEWMPMLASWKEWSEADISIDKDLVIQYVIYTYDRYSPFRSRYPDILERKVQVAKYLAFPVDDEGNFFPTHQDIMHNQDDEVMKMIIRYVREHRSALFTFVVAAEEEYYRDLKKMLTGEDTDKKLQMKKMQQDLDDAILELFNKDNSEILEMRLFKYVEEENLQLRPEDIAIKLQEGIDPVVYEDIFG